MPLNPFFSSFLFSSHLFFFDWGKSTTFFRPPDRPMGRGFFLALLVPSEITFLTALGLTLCSLKSDAPVPSCRRIRDALERASLLSIGR